MSTEVAFAFSSGAIYCSCSRYQLRYVSRDLKGPLSSLTQFLTTESFLEMMKNAFYFMLEAYFVPKVFKILSFLFGHVGKRLDEKAMFNFKVYDVTDWIINNYNK